MKGVGGGRFGPMASAVQTLDSSIHRINYYPTDKYYRKQLCYPLDRNLSGGERYPSFEQPGPGEWYLSA